MGKLRGLSKLISKLPTGFSIDQLTGILYHSQDSVTDEIGKVSIPEDRHYSFLIKFKDIKKEEFYKYKDYWECLNKSLATEKVCAGFVLIYMPFPKL
jgi:hypothetical protein